MAKFIAYYNLCPIHDTKEFLGLSKDTEEGNVIVTLGKNIVILQLNTQKLVRNWSTQEKLSSKVVFDKKSEQYVGVFCNKYIRCWDANTIDINKMKKIKFQKEISEIVSCDVLEEVLLIYFDGSCESLSSGIESRKEILERNSISMIDGQNQFVLNSNVFISRDGRKQLTYFHRNDKENTTELVTTLLSEENLKSSELKRYPLQRPAVNLVGYTVVEGQNFPTLLTIWSDKKIFQMTLKDDVPTTDAPGHFVSILSIFNLDNPISIIGISTHCVAIYGANSVQEGGSIVLYNTQFKVVKAKQFFKIYFDFSRLWVVENHILLAMGQNLSVVTFRVSKEHLSELIGSQISTDLSAQIEYDFINEEEELEEILSFGTQPNEKIKSQMRTMKDNCKVQSRKEDLEIADGKGIPFVPFEVFENDFRFICNNNDDIEVEIVAGNYDDIEIDLMTNYHDSGFFTKEIDTVAKTLEKTGASEQEITEKLLCALIKLNNVEDMIACLRRYTYISEKALVKVLKYALLNYVPNKTENENENEGNPSSTKLKDIGKFNLINVILSCSFDSENIALYIRKELDFNEILILMKYLYNIITNPEHCLEDRPETSVDFDEDIIILQWFNVILSTHFQQLALSRDIELGNLLTKWLDIINLFKTNEQDLCNVSSLLYQLINGKLDCKEKVSSKWYSIEEVKLY